MSSNGRYSGVVVSQKKISGRRQILGIMLRNGDVKEFSSDNVAFAVPGFSKLLDLSVEFDAGAETIEHPPKDKFKRAISDYQRTIFLKKGAALRSLSKMYTHFQNESGEATKVSLEELSKYAFSAENPTYEQLHATFDYVVANNIHFMPTASVRITQMWMLRSAKETKNITQIVEWIRSRSAVYTGFLERARALIEFYEAHADPQLGTLSPSAVDTGKIYASKLTESDKMFIDFIADWIKSPKVIVDPPHAVFVPTILKGLKCYDELFFDTSLAIKFLRQIGMLKPWDNVSLLQTANVMQEWIWSERSAKNDERMQHYAKLFLQRGGQQDSVDGMHDLDECDAIRHDFGNLPVYTIDDPSAKEIDDGVSIERIPGGATWLHVHIADPSAYIPPGHELANIMQQKVQTLYLPEQHFPILPNALSAAKFSLGATAQKLADGSQYAMTFSAQINDSGNLTAWKVRPSLVRNVQKIYYDDLDILYDKHSIPRDAADPLVDLTRSFTHPTSIPTIHSDNQHSNNQQQQQHSTVIDNNTLQDLLDLYHFTQKHYRFRLQCGAVNFGFPSPNVSIDPNPLPLPAFSFTEPQYAAHLPAIRVSLDKSSTSPARKMIAETMIVGGRVATHYAKEHGVAMPYRTQTWPQSVTQDELDMRNKMLSLRDINGKIKIADMIRYMEVLPPAALSTVPGQPHVLMGIPDGYARVTSPLRRYMDIVTHWQLKAHLLGKPMPFDVEALNRLGPRIEAREKLMSGLERRSVQFWVVELIRRLMAESHGRDMEWTCLVSRESKSGQSKLGASIEVASGTILELGIRGRLENVPSNLQVGQVVKARIREVDASMQSIVLDCIHVE